MPYETAAVSVQVMCTPYNHAPCHLMQSHIRKVHACLAVTCHLHFWQNDRDLLRAIVATEFSPPPSQFNSLVLFTSVTVLILFQLCWLCLSKSLLILRCLESVLFRFKHVSYCLAVIVLFTPTSSSSECRVQLSCPLPAPFSSGFHKVRSLGQSCSHCTLSPL